MTRAELFAALETELDDPSWRWNEPRPGDAMTPLTWISVLSMMLGNARECAIEVHTTPLRTSPRLAFGASLRELAAVTLAAMEWIANEWGG